MIELMFVLTTVFVAYVVYSIAQEKQQIDKGAAFSGADSPNRAGNRGEDGEQLTGIQVEKTAPAPQPKAGAAKSRPEPRMQPEPVPVKPAKSTATVTNASVLRPPVGGRSAIRNPKTGEVASLASNYRFMKRWVKEALVAEGLLDKIYKNNELDAGAESRIKQALLELQEKESYRA